MNCRCRSRRPITPTTSLSRCIGLARNGWSRLTRTIQPDQGLPPHPAAKIAPPLVEPP